VFSARLTADLRPNRLTLALQERKVAGLAVLDLTDSNPTRAGFEYPEDLLTPLADARGLHYAPLPFGLLAARRAVAADYARRGITVDPSRIALTASTSEAYSLLFKLLASPGDEILVPRPSYPLFDHLTALDGVIPRAYDLDDHGSWSIDFSSLDDALGPKTRAVLIVHPNNPTGSFISESDRERLASVCGRHGLAIIADEVFADYSLEPDAPGGSLLTRDDVLVFALGGLSKSIGLPQVKLGWIATAGPAAIVEAALSRLELVCDTYLSVSTPVQLAASELLQCGAGVRAQIAARLSNNYARLRALVSDVPSCRLLRAEGGWYAVVQVPSFQSEEELVIDLLTVDGVLVHPGYFFDFPRESFVIVSLLPRADVFASGVARLLDRAAGIMHVEPRGVAAQP
jgi:aspartate/methionine/tyrosine aminotransferase